jgi:hypothetical protein
MKGTLTKTEQGWVVNYNYSVNNNDWCTILLHPDFIEMMDTCFTSKFTHEIEFEIVTEWENGEVGVNGLTYAKLIHHPVDTNKMIDHIGEVNEMVDDKIFQQSILAMEAMYGSGCDAEIDAYFRGAKWMQQQIYGGDE